MEGKQDHNHQLFEHYEYPEFARTEMHAGSMLLDVLMADW